MKTCKYCNNISYDHELYCTKCGSQFDIAKPTCSYCGNDLKTWHDQNCISCGASINFDVYPNNMGFKHCKKCKKKIPYHAEYCAYCGQSAIQTEPQSISISNTKSKSDKTGIKIAIIVISAIFIITFAFMATIVAMIDAAEKNYENEYENVITIPNDDEFTDITVEELFNKFYNEELEEDTFYNITGTISNIESTRIELSCETITQENRKFTVILRNDYDIAPDIINEIIKYYKIGDKITVKGRLKNIWQSSDEIDINVYKIL